MTVRILVGDCREVLKQSPDNHFHCVVTSPPFWGLRDYGIPPSVWGGEAECGHVWGQDIPPRRERYNGDQGANSIQQHNRGASYDAKPSQFCQLCGAWLGCLGLEPTPELYVEHLVECFRAVRRVLRDDGVMWVNLGDSYAGSWGNYGAREGKQRSRIAERWHRPAYEDSRTGWNGLPPTANVPGCKPKDLVGIPWAVAFALRDDGWWLRSAIIWHKPNCMPESVTDRPTNDYEFVFLLAKSEQYFYDQEAIREPQTGNAHSRGRGLSPKGFLAERGRDRSNTSFHASTARYVDVPRGRNKRAVWTIPTSPFPGAHFATFPPALVEPCIKAGTSERGACPECGAPWERVVERDVEVPDNYGNMGAHGSKWLLQDEQSSGHRIAKNMNALRALGRDHDNPFPIKSTIGWRPTCSCYDDSYRQFPRARSARKRWQQDISDRWWPRVRQRPGKDDWPTVPCRVLDPMGGAGTTAMVADRLKRDAVSIDIKPEYAAMSRDRIVKDAGPMFAQVSLEV